MSRLPPILFGVALVIGGGIPVVWLREPGFVGEVGLASLAQSPQVRVRIEPELWADGARDPSGGHRWGPLISSQTRPIERLDFAHLSLPIAINSYTGGIPDWPARTIIALGVSPLDLRWFHLVCGLVLVALVHRFSRFHLTEASAVGVAWLLVCRWDFQVWRALLGGTELVLLLAVLLVLWGIWSRRWSGGRWGWWPVGLALGLGLHAKITFVLALFSLGLALMLTRWDRPRLLKPVPKSLVPVFLGPLLGLLPLGVANLHQQCCIDPDLWIWSHDRLELQLGRLVQAGSSRPAQESLVHGLGALLDPLTSFVSVHRVDPEMVDTAAMPLATLGWGITLVGVGLAWRERAPVARDALLRLLSLWVPLHLGAIWVFARELHHFAVASIPLCLLHAAAADQIVGRTVGARRWSRVLWVLLLLSPHLGAGLVSIRATDDAILRSPVPTFGASAQVELASLIRQHAVKRLMVADYEAAGVLEAYLPEVEITHGWGAVSLREPEMVQRLAKAAEGGHFLVLQASAPFVYNARPRREDLEGPNRVVREVGRLSQGRAILYAVDAESGDRVIER